MAISSEDAAASTIVISNEDQAVEVLRAALDGEPFENLVQVQFSGWPTLTIQVSGRDWHGTVPTRIMPPLMEIQKDLHRLYAQTKYGESTSRRLTDGEREKLEVIVKVDEGSSDYTADLSQILEQIFHAAVGKMTGPEIIIAIVGVALVYFGSDVAKAYIAARQAGLDKKLSVELSKEETRRIEIVAESANRSALVAEAKSNAEESTHRVLKTLKPQDHIQLGEDVVQGYEAAAIAREPRATAERWDLEGVFRILVVDTTASKGFKVRVVRIGDGLDIRAIVPIELDDEQQKLIQDAEWQKKPINLWIEAIALRDKVIDATILRAQPVETRPRSSRRI